MFGQFWHYWQGLAVMLFTNAQPYVLVLAGFVLVS
jgi:hypothetical protein